VTRFQRSVLHLPRSLSLAALAVVGCGPGARPDTTDSVDASVNGTDCSEAAKLIYVVDYTKEMHSFDPAMLAFASVGSVSCMSASAFSMAVDRHAVARVHSTDGTLVRFDIPTATCTPLPFAAGQHGFVNFGMGFASNSMGSQDETLYVGSDVGLGLATIDLNTYALTKIGLFDISGRPELTGTGEGKLYGLFEASPYSVAEINKTTASSVSTAPQTVSGVSNFAFAFWGADFYLFVAKDVYRYRPSDQTTVKVTTTTFDVVGAGVSTCAPTVLL